MLYQSKVFQYCFCGVFVGFCKLCNKLYLCIKRNVILSICVCVWECVLLSFWIQTFFDFFFVKWFWGSVFVSIFGFHSFWIFKIKFSLFFFGMFLFVLFLCFFWLKCLFGWALLCAILWISFLCMFFTKKIVPQIVEFY